MEALRRASEPALRSSIRASNALRARDGALGGDLSPSAVLPALRPGLVSLEALANAAIVFEEHLRTSRPSSGPSSVLAERPLVQALGTSTHAAP